MYAIRSYYDFHARDLLDCAKIVHVIDVAKADGGSAKTRPAGAPDAMDVCFRHVRQIVVDHVRQFGDIDAPCCDVGCHKNLYASVTKAFERILPRVLRLVAVDGARDKPRNNFV